ncbi:MAG: glutamine-hydrolyzing GMP synthase [Candidatus Aminicenantes bacterium]|nr:glutamine-hydrolyzing GMP synthase [Candidatus Aminicenantes bacterium]
MKNRVLILDFGSQYTKLIARRIRELKVYTEIIPFRINIDQIRTLSPGAIILSGGPSSVYKKNAPKISRDILNLGIPILGICYGLQLIAFLSGMVVDSTKNREYGLATLEIGKKENRRLRSQLLKKVKNNSKVWMSHGDIISQFPRDFIVTARTENSEIAVIESEKRKLYGVQFHPEVIHTTEGTKLLSNFVFNIAGLKPDWDMENFIKSTIINIKNKVGKEKIILGLSGGVDSTVLALLLKKAIGKQLIPVFIDTGLLRKNEYKELMSGFKNKLDLNVIGIEAADIFIAKLANISSPEKKRKVIGKTFIDVFQSVEERVGKVKYLAQGTLYPDVIESVSVNGPSVTIKSHHNVGGLPKKMNWKLIEPFKELFKDEVRKVGKELGLEDELINRHPFPGPGLAVRIIGRITREKIEKLQQADLILHEELLHFNIYNQVWQAFIVLLSVKSVGVMGDIRTYENVAVIRMVNSIDGMTADWYPAPYDFLKKVSSRIVNEVKGINRVTYDLTSKPPGTIEWE